MSSSKMIVLKSSDGETFEVEEDVALKSQIIKRMIEDNCTDTSIPLPKVTSKILAKVIEYCKKHVEAAKSSDEDLKSFDADFVKVDQGTLYDLILVAGDEDTYIAKCIKIKAPSRSIDVSVSWLAPVEGKFKLNTDAAISHTGASDGGVLRDHLVKVIFAFHKARTNNVLMAEGEALDFGLELYLK